MDDIRKIQLSSEEYPKLLKEIHNPPAHLYVRGTIPYDGIAIGVVGPRIASAYGKQITARLVRDCTHAGVVIISGLAMGIDGAAHEAALEARGITLAILGSGIDDKSIYPPQHKNLASRIIRAGGAIISEYPPGSGPERFHFPERNRIIAGMSHGVLVIEAREKSGALITAALALQENRDVFAVPGPINTETSRGTNRLLQQGAKAVLDAKDILEEYDIDIDRAEGPPRLQSKEEQAILECLKGDALHADEIRARTNADPASLNTLLVMMELKGIIKSLGSGKYGII